MRPSATIGPLVSRPSRDVPLPMPTRQATPIPATCRCCIEWAGVPPGCGHAALGTASGSTTARSAMRWSGAIFVSLRSTATRSPGSGFFGGAPK